MRFAVLCFVLLCYTALHCALMCCVLLCLAVLRCVVLCFDAFNVILCCVVLCSQEVHGF